MNTPTLAQMMNTDLQEQTGRLLRGVDPAGCGCLNGFRTRYQKDLALLWNVYPQVLGMPADCSVAKEFQERAEAMVELALAAAVFSIPPAEAAPPPRFGVRRTCGHAPLDRECLGCGMRLCARCQPKTGGSPCVRCHGPVWLCNEERNPPVVNPAMRRF